MSFLAPWALGLAAFAALPVALHLLRRDTRRRLAFPAIRYLRQARERSARALKLRDRLLLLTRTCLVAVLAAAAAAPLVGRGDVADHEPTNLVLLIDNTASMNRTEGGTTLLERQLSRARTLLDAARSGDRFWILPAVGPILAAGVPAGDATDAIGRVEATDASANLGAGIREAVRLLPPGAARPREIVVLSDFQASAIPGPGFEVPPDTRLVASRIEASSANGAVIDLLVDPPVPGGDGTVLAQLLAPGPGADTLEVRLRVGATTASITRVEAGGTAVLRLPDPGVGEHAVSVEMPPSGLRSDDRRSFVLRTFAPPVVGHEGPSDSYVALALATLERAGRLRLGETEGETAAWFVEGVPPPGLPMRGEVAWILAPPADSDLLARFNAGLERLGIPWRVDLADATGGDVLEPSPDVPGLEAIRIRARHRLRRAGTGSDSVFITTASGAPWLVGGRAADRSYLLIATPLTPESTELPVTAAMVPLIEAVLFRWSDLGGSLPRPVPAGTASALPAGADSVERPDGTTIRVDGGSPYVPLRAGVHTVFLADGGTSLLAATVPRSESDLAAAPAAGIAAALGSSATVVTGTEDEWRARIYGSRRGMLATPYLVALALLLVLAEVALATPGERAAAAGHARQVGGRP